MDSLISGIIDCVARPSTTDSPVRMIRKSASDSPRCVSSTPSESWIQSEGGSGRSAAHLDASGHSRDSSEASSSSPLAPPRHVRAESSSSTLSRLMVPEESPSMSAVPISSVLTAEGIIVDDRPFACMSCGDYAAGCGVAGGSGNDDGTIQSSGAESIDAAVVRQFEAAFATFLYKNPAFANMSHTTISRLRSKLLRESARNVAVEEELRRQLADLREAKRNRELELQRELLVVTRAKASREAELLLQIQKTRRSSMHLEERLSTGNLNGSTPPSSPKSPGIQGSDSFEEFQREIRRNKMEQAHILAEMEKIKMQIAQETVAAGTP